MFPSDTPILISLRGKLILWVIDPSGDLAGVDPRAGKWSVLDQGFLLLHCVVQYRYVTIVFVILAARRAKRIDWRLGLGAIPSGAEP